MMWLKVEKVDVDYLESSIHLSSLFSWFSSYGNYNYYLFIPTVKIQKVCDKLNDILFNTSAEIVYISEEETHRMGISYSRQKGEK